MITKNKGFRRTTQRDHILSVLKGRGRHLSAEEVYDEVRKELPAISLGTVYRNLRMMADLDVVLELKAGDRSYFETNFFKEPHHHLICRSCGGIEDIQEEIKTYAKPSGFKVDYHIINFYGRCKKCLGGR